MSDFNFENWDLNESSDRTKKKIHRVSPRELSDMINGIKESILENGLWNRQYGINDPAADKRGEDLERRSWDEDLSSDEWDELQGHYDNMDADDRDRDAQDFFVGGIEIEDAKRSMENDPGVTIVDDPVDAGMFEMDGAEFQAPISMGMDESNENDQDIDAQSRYDLAMRDAEDEDFDGLSAASEIFSTFANNNRPETEEWGELEYVGEMSESEDDTPEWGELEYVGTNQDDSDVPEWGELEYAGEMSEEDEERHHRTLDGLEGPFRYASGRELYYDPREEGGQYYDRGSDYYLSNDEASRIVMGEQSDADELDIDINDQGSAGSFYTGEGDSSTDMMDEQNFIQRMFAPKQGRELPNAVKKHSELPSKFMAWVQAYKTGKDARTKTMLAKKVLDMVQDIGSEEEAIKNLAHWVNYNPDGFVEMFKQLRADAENSLMREIGDNQRSLPEPFWSHGFPQVRITDIADAINDSMIPGQDKGGTLELIDVMRYELDQLESKIKSEN